MARARPAGASNNVARNSSNNDATSAALFKPLSSVRQALVRYLLRRDCGATAQNKSVAHIVRASARQYLHAAGVANGRVNHGMEALPRFSASPATRANA